MSAFVIGIGSSGPGALEHIEQALVAMEKHPQLDVKSVSRLYENPAVGGATSSRFVNGALVIETALHPLALLSALHAIEARLGRVRVVKNGARSLDLDVLWSLDAVAPSSSPVLPHPRVLERAFAVVPALEAIERAKRAAPSALAEAGRRLATGAQLVVVTASR
jgi:2-amino-4-hydroxy-6-hydroxymethyldihydropteridine diphosphokinase